MTCCEQYYLSLNCCRLKLQYYISFLSVCVCISVNIYIFNLESLVKIFIVCVKVDGAVVNGNCL